MIDRQEMAEVVESVAARLRRNAPLDGISLRNMAALLLQEAEYLLIESGRVGALGVVPAQAAAKGGE